jgi:hypothetical protein
MTGPSRRLWLVTTGDRREPGPAHPARVPPSGRPGPVPLPTPSIRPSGLAGAAPHWPDQPLHRAPGRQERVRSPA